MHDKVISEEAFMLKLCPDTLKTQEMRDKAADFYLITLKFVPDCFVTNKMLEKLDNFAFSIDDIFFHDVGSHIITFLDNDISFNSIGLNNINLDDDNFDKDDPGTINHVRLMTWHNRCKQRKRCQKISEELMSAV